MRFYDSETQALRRVEKLKDEAGYWPGVIGPDAHGQYRLTHDPALSAAQGVTGILEPPDLRPDCEHPQHKEASHVDPAPQPQLETDAPEADLDRFEADAWLQDDLQEGSVGDDPEFVRLREAELAAELEADHAAEADWGL